MIPTTEDQRTAFSFHQVWEPNNERILQLQIINITIIIMIQDPGVNELNIE